MFEDKAFICKDCRNAFIFSAAEQKFFVQNNYEEPCRCPECRAIKKRHEGHNPDRRKRFPVICSGCGKRTSVPFLPDGERPTFCRNCFHPAGW